MAEVRQLLAVPDVVGPPASGNAVIVHGRHIPNMTCHDYGDQIEFVLDGRFAYRFPKEWSFLAAAMAAQAMAIGAGFSSMNAETKDRPFAPEICEIVLSK